MKKKKSWTLRLPNCLRVQSRVTPAKKKKTNSEQCERISKFAKSVLSTRDAAKKSSTNCFDLGAFEYRCRSDNFLFFLFFFLVLSDKT